MRQYKKELIKTLFDSSNQLQKDIEDIKNFIDLFNDRYNQSAVKLIKSIEKCLNDNYELMNDLIIGDKEASIYYNELVQEEKE